MEFTPNYKKDKNGKNQDNTHWMKGSELQV